MKILGPSVVFVMTLFGMALLLNACSSEPKSINETEAVLEEMSEEMQAVEQEAEAIEEEMEELDSEIDQILDGI